MVLLACGWSEEWWWAYTGGLRRERGRKAEDGNGDTIFQWLRMLAQHRRWRRGSRSERGLIFLNLPQVLRGERKTTIFWSILKISKIIIWQHNAPRSCLTHSMLTSLHKITRIGPSSGKAGASIHSFLLPLMAPQRQLDLRKISMDDFSHIWMWE